MDEVRLAVLGPSAAACNPAVQGQQPPKSPMVTVSATSGKVTVSSAAMAAAVVAAHGSNWRPVISSSQNPTTSSSSSKQPPYSPRSSLLSPVKFGDQLQPQLKAVQPPSGSSYTSYRLPSYSKDNLIDKLRQEAWVSKRVSDLTREGLWSDKRLPKVCERPRPRTHWDSVLTEMQWLSVDFHEERQWKMAAAKMLAHSAKIYVEQQGERRAKKAAMLEKKHRRIAKFMADQVELFWQSISSNIHSEKKPYETSKTSTTELLLQGEASSESGVCNLDEEDSGSELNFADNQDSNTENNGESSDYFEPDDESTIDEQETFEALNNEVVTNQENEILVLEQDNTKAVEEVLATSYPGYDLVTRFNDIQNDHQHDSSLSSDDSDADDIDSDDDDTGFDTGFTPPATQNVVIKMPLSGCQRKLYDDYLSSSQSKLDSLDAKSIATVLQTLRKICDRPQLLEVPGSNPQDGHSSQSVPEKGSPLSFCRIIDGLKIPYMVSKAANYNPMTEINLASLNLVFFTHESTLTAITSDRIRKCCAPKTLIEDLGNVTTVSGRGGGNSSSNVSSQCSTTLQNSCAPQIPLYQFNYGSDGWNLDSQAKTSRNPSQKNVNNTVNKQLKQNRTVWSSSVRDQVLAGNSKGEKTATSAFHRDSLNVIAKFNERRCNGMPLYGQDLIEVLTIVSPDAICSPPRIRTASNIWKGSGYVQPGAEEKIVLPGGTGNNALFWPFFGAKSGSAGRHRQRSSHRHLRTRWLKSVTCMPDLSAIPMTIHSDLVLPPKVNLVAGFNRTHLALTSKHLAVEEAVKFARAKSVQNQRSRRRHSWLHPIPRRQPLFQTSAESKRLRELSSKLSRLDVLLRQFRSQGERTLIFCEMPEMLELLRHYLHLHQISFAYLDPNANIKERLTILEDFTTRNNFLALLTSPPAASQQPSSSRRFNGYSDICNVIFFDSSGNGSQNVDHSEILDWCQTFNGVCTSLRVYKLVCEDTVEDSLSIQALGLQGSSTRNSINQQNQISGTGSAHDPENQRHSFDLQNHEPICKIKKHALEALFNTHFAGDNGVLSGKNEKKEKKEKEWWVLDSNPGPSASQVGKETALEEILEDPEVLAQLDWLWSNKMENDTEEDSGPGTTGCLVELSQQVDKGCVKEELKPIEKYARDYLLPSLLKHGSERALHKGLLFSYEDSEDIEAAKLEWEVAYQKEIALLASEIEDLEKMDPTPILTYTREDSSRSWHGLDGAPMPLWTPPIPLSNPASESKFRVEEHLSYLYQSVLMEEVDLPPVFVKKELGLKRTAAEAGINNSEIDKHGKMLRKQEGDHNFGSTPGGTYAPRSLFDRHPAFQKQKLKAQQKRLPLGSGSYVHGPLPATFQPQNAVSSLRHPIPRQQVEAENQPEWLIQEDWALLHTIKDVQGLPLSLNTMSPAHTVNWDLVSDMVNAVSRVYRGPRQCKQRFDNIIAPREEGRILYDMPTSGLANNKNKKNKNKLPNMKGGLTPGTPGAPGTSGGLGSTSTTGSGNSKMNKPMKTSQIFNLDKNSSWSSLFASRFETIKAVANKRSPTTKPLVVNPSQKNTNKHAAVLAESGITYETPLNPIQVAANRAERIQKEKQKNAQDQAAQLNQQKMMAAQAAASAAQQSAAATARVAIVQQQQQQSTSAGQQQAVVVGIPTSQHQQVRQVISQQSVQELVRSQQGGSTVVTSQQQSQPTVVVTSHLPVVSVGSLTPQLAQTLVKQAGGSKTVTQAVGTSGATSLPTRQLTPQAINILKQQALMRKKNENNKQLQGINQTSVSAGNAVSAAGSGTATGSSGQKVSIAVTPSGVTLATLANSMPVTVVTQALGQSQKTRLIRGVSGTGKGNSLRMTGADMKLLLASKQRLQAQQKAGTVTTSQQQSVTQLLQGIQSGQQVTTLVKSRSAGSGSVTSSGQGVTIPVQMQSVQGIKTLRTSQNQGQPSMVHLRHQLVQGGPRSKIIPQGGQTILATSQQGQKVALSQVAAGTKGVPAQLIVSSGNSRKPVTVQQIHQIKGQTAQGQQLIPHNILKASQGSTVQARVIPATVAGRPQQIRVVAAPASAAAAAAAAAANNPRGASAAPNVTVDATGRPSPTQSSLVTAGSQIRVAAGTSQQLLNQVLGARVTQTPTTKLQVVHAPVPQSSTVTAPQPQTSQQQSQQQAQSTQQNQQGGASGDQNQQQKN